MQSKFLSIKVLLKHFQHIKCGVNVEEIAQCNSGLSKTEGDRTKFFTSDQLHTWQFNSL